MSNLQVDAVLFDIDGTLVDVSHSYLEAVRRTAEYLLSEPVTAADVNQVKRLPGFNNDWDATWGVVQQRRHGVVSAPTAADRESSEYARLVNVFQTLYLGHRMWHDLSGSEPPLVCDEPLILEETALASSDLFAGLQGIGLGIATSRPRVEALMAVRQHQMSGYFEEAFIVALEDAPHEKPHPAPLIELARRLNCSAPVYVGDTINDALAARAAGIPFILVGNESLMDPEIPVAHHLDDVNALMTVLETPLVEPVL